MTTSLQLFPNRELTDPDVPPEWGTGKHKQKTNLWTPKPASWWYTGKPIGQYYDLTLLKRSNVRWNDQLLPKPQEGDMTTRIINKPFPSEHPYSSHTPRYAVFPSFAENPEDPKRGVDARRQKPLSSECPASGYDVQIVSKAKGFGLRREIQDLPSEGQKKGLTWHGEDFSQLVKSHGGKREIYPTPIKTVVPNLEHRHAGQTPISQKTSNTLRNLEREQWQTTYDLAHTGLGPSNPKKLDNYEDKSYTKASTGEDDDVLYPRSIRTFDPPRLMEGRIARNVTPKQEQQIKYSQPRDTGYNRKMTLTEKEEHRLLNGSKHINLPDTSVSSKHDGSRWKTLNDTAHPDGQLSTLESTQAMFPPDVIPWQPATSATEIKKEGQYLNEMQQVQHDAHQQMESENRWKLLESQKPNHDIAHLQRKYDTLDKIKGKDKPPTFYKHEGQYQTERAGLYSTSYNPYSLAEQMNKDRDAPSRAMDTSMSHQDALHLPTELNWETDAALYHSKTDTSKPTYTFSDRPPARDIIEPHEFNTEMQRRHLQPVASNAGVKVQEKDLILTQSTMGASYNTPKFLQENELEYYGRNEPNELMSHMNKNLSNVRSRSSPKTGKSVQFNDSVMVATLSDGGVEPSRVGRAHISSPKRELFEEPASEPVLHVSVGKPQQHRETRTVEIPVSVNTTQYNSMQAQYIPDVELENTKYQPSFVTEAPKLTRSNTEPNMSLSPKVNTSPLRSTSPNAKQFFGKQETHYKDQFQSKSSNIAPSGITSDSMMFKTSYHSQFPGSTLDLSYKDDTRFKWEPGCGFPREPTTLTKIQDRFTKSSAYGKFYSQFPEKNPDLRENIVFGKKHSFAGMNAQILRGTPVEA